MYEFLWKKNILNRDEIQLLHFIHSNIRVSMGEKEVTTSRGVPQGLITSPILFDIYVEDLLYSIQEAGLFGRMFADDLIILAPTQYTAIQGIEIVEKMSDNLKMTLNRKKSGILTLNRPYEDGDLNGFPYVPEYKYLGTCLTSNLEPDCHLKTIGRKSDFQTRKLAPLRHRLDMRFNVNLFKMLVMPGVRLLGSIHRHTSTTGKNKIEVHVRKRLRSFCLLPWSCPNEFVEVLIGNTKMLLDGLARAVDHKANCRRAGMIPNSDYLNDLKLPKIHAYIPRRLTRLMQMMYGNLCKDHPTKPLNRGHLSEAHGNGIDPVALIQQCVDGESPMVRERLAEAIREVSLLAKAKAQPGAARRGIRKRNPRN